MSVVLDVVEESSKSRSGKHVLRQLVFIYSREKGLVPLSRLPERIVSRSEAEKTYRRGRATRYSVRLKHGDYLLIARFIRNFYGKVKGSIEVYNYHGELVYRAKYVDRELRRSTGNPIYAWLVRLLAEKLKIPVKKTLLGDEKHAS